MKKDFDYTKSRSEREIYIAVTLQAEIDDLRKTIKSKDRIIEEYEKILTQIHKLSYIDEED